MDECLKCGKCCIEFSGGISLEADDCMLVLMHVSQLAGKLKALGTSSNDYGETLGEILEILRGIDFPMPISYVGSDIPGVELILGEIEHERVKCECGCWVTRDDYLEDEDAYRCPRCKRLMVDFVVSHCAWYDPMTSQCKFHDIRPRMCRDYPTKDSNYTCLNGVVFSPEHDQEAA